MCKKTKKAEFVLAEEPYYCVPAVRSGMTDSSFGKWGQVSISFVLRGEQKLLSHSNEHRNLPRPLFISVGPKGKTNNSRSPVFHSPFTH